MRSYRVLLWVLRMSTTRTMSCCGIPSVMATTRGISAAMASSIDAAASDGGTKIALRFNSRQRPAHRILGENSVVCIPYLASAVAKLKSVRTRMRGGGGAPGHTSGLPHRLSDGSEHGPVEVHGSSLSGVDTADNLGAILDRLLCVKAMWPFPSASVLPLPPASRLGGCSRSCECGDIRTIPAFR